MISNSTSAEFLSYSGILFVKSPQSERAFLLIETTAESAKFPDGSYQHLDIQSESTHIVRVFIIIIIKHKESRM